MFLPCLPSRWVSPGCLSTSFNWTKWWFWHFFEHGIVLILWRVCAILGNVYGIQGQNYVAMYHGSDGWPREVLDIAETKTIRN